MEGFEANAELENGERRAGGTSFDDRGCQEERRNTVSATRNPLRNLTNVNPHSAGQPQSLYASITLPTPQQDASEVTSEEVDELFDQYIVWPLDDDAVPQQDSASGSQHSTNTTRSQEKRRALNDLDEDEDEDDIYANEVGVCYGANVDDSDGEASPVPESLPARTPTTDPEVISPYPSEPQDSPAPSPLAEVSGTQSRSSEASSLKKSQSRPSEEPSPSTDAPKEQASTSKRTSPRKRRLSESEDQPNKRPASESKVQSIAIATPQPSPAHAATPSTAPLPAAGVPVNAAAVESAAPSRATHEGTRQREASKATTTTNAIPAVSVRAASQATTASAPPRHNPASSGSHRGTTNANASDIVRASSPNVQLPELASSATNEGVDQRSAQEATTNANPSVSSGVAIQTPAAPLAVPVPVNAARRRTNTVAPSNVPTEAPVISSTLVSSPDSEAPAPRSGNQGAGKKGASTKGKGRCGAGSSEQGNENGQTAVPPPPFGGMQLVWHSGNPGAVVGNAPTDPSTASQPSGASKKKPENGYFLYRNTMFKLRWSAKKVKLGWSTMPDSEKNVWRSKADLKKVEEAAKRQGNSLSGQSTSSASPSPSPGPSAQNDQAQTIVDLSTVPGPSTAPTEESIQYGQVGPSGTQQQQPQAPAMPPMQQFAPDPRYQAPPNGFPATHYPTIGGYHHYPPANANQAPPSYYHMPQVSIPFNGYPPQGMLMAPPNFWAYPRPGYGMAAPPPNAHYLMNRQPTTNNAYDDNANANTGPSVPATNASSSFNPPQGSSGYYQAAAMNANTVTGPSVSSTPTNVPWGQGPQSWTPTPWYPDQPGDGGPTGNNWTDNHPPQHE
ncbi:hypothetical protein EST38_g9179 [Candolleomyces aberdarensis]|uniref:Uncharacterized protein n=1 Tax=Candolleomyces aberdarensis TaxID=2316362 RepID=A0A4Q2DDU2_9AGAR|nr:hypothetical protein EST38_g9179 [Candolleomyces aberdarensis]